MPRLTFAKCQGAGNDFLIFEDPTFDAARYAALARSLCDRRLGVGADGLLVLSPASSRGADIAMRVFNADGSEAEMCGNGVRCVARYVAEEKRGAPAALNIETKAGIVRTEIRSGGTRFAVRVDMGAPRSVMLWVEPAAIHAVSVRGADVSLGNPHCVLFVDDDPSALDLDALADAAIAEHLAGADVNVEVARIVDGAVALRVRERGVGETAACGTGACAAAVAAIATRAVKSPVDVSMRGGDVVVEWSGGDAHVFLTGGAEIVYRAQIDFQPAALVAIP